MAQALQKIDIVYFTDNWISRIKPEVGDNWRLKISNLKKVLKGILDYNQEVLQQQINDFTLPDINLIENTQTLQSWAGCYNSYWAVLSTVSRNKKTSRP
nr:protein Hook homolog 3-like [Salvelinus alpinus]